MDIAVIGATGFVGSKIVAEALDRGHQVSAYTRSGTSVPGASAHELSLGDTPAVVDVINAHDFTVIAVADRVAPQSVIDAHQALINAGPKRRLLVVGGAGSLVVDGVRLYETPGFPEEFKSEAQTFSAILDDYQENATGLEWTMISPSPELADGVRSGTYTLGGNTPVGDYLSTQDLAVAVLDEAETPAHTRQRFTASSTRP